MPPEASLRLTIHAIPFRQAVYSDRMKLYPTRPEFDLSAARNHYPAFPAKKSPVFYSVTDVIRVFSHSNRAIYFVLSSFWRIDGEIESR
jgi:hypothetical protein